MKIAYIGNFDPPHSTENHVAKATENLGHTVTRLPEQRLEWADVPDLTDGHDLLLWTRTGAFEPPDQQRQRTALQATTIPKVGFHLDRWHGLARETTEMGPNSPNPSCFFTELDLLCTANGDPSAEWATRHVWMPPAILSDETEPGTPMSRYTADVAFVGNLQGYGHKEWAPYRQQLSNHLHDWYRGRVQIFPGKGRPAIRGRDLANLYATIKVAVGDSCLAGNPTRYISDRVPETCGRGAYLIHPHVDGVTPEHYPDLTTYELGNWEELHAKIEYALQNPEWRVENAAKNRQHVLANHTYEHRMKRLLSII